MGNFAAMIPLSDKCPYNSPYICINVKSEMSQESANNPVPTLHALMEKANAQYRVFDLGRRIQPISKSEFEKVEANQKPYPFPIQQKARFAVVFWDKSDSAKHRKNPFIWFLQFDLDEVGLLKLQQRDHYISLVLKELGSQLVADGSQSADKLDNHPYSFTPDQHRLATFNAKVKVELKQPASMYYEHAQAYFKGEIDVDKWQDLTVQGIADFSVRIADDQNSQALCAILSDLPVQIMGSLAASLEHVDIDIELTKALIDVQNLYLQQGDREQVINSLRCLSGSQSKPLVAAQLLNLFNSEEAEDESMYIVIAGRLWPWLNEREVLMGYFEKVAKHGNKNLFAGLFTDLVAVPEIRPALLSMVRDADRPDAISVAIGRVFGTA